MSEMKLIMENWRKNVLLIEAEDGPETVGELLTAIEATTKLFNNKSTKIMKKFIVILDEMIGEAQALDIGEDDIRAFIEASEDFLENVLEKGWLKASTIALREFPVNALSKFLKRPAVQKIVVAKLGAGGFEFLLNTIFPGAAVVLKAGRWMGRIFRVSKASKEILDTANATPQEMFTGIVKDIMSAPDNKATTSGFFKHFNIDDEYQKMLHDKIEIEFISHMIDFLKKLNKNEKLDNIDFNQNLVSWLETHFKGRALAGHK